jgi:Protein of unknown function (DUF541)
MQAPRIPVRVAVAAAVSLAVIGAGAGIGGASASSRSPQAQRAIWAPSSGVAVSAFAPSMTPVESSFGWCCSRSGPGLTATGQASVSGQGTNGRDQAIAQAVADATNQATAAADAAGVTLGRILDMQVSAYMAYPCVAGEAGDTAIAGQTANGRASPPNGTVGSYEPSVACPAQSGVESYATVTMTWSIE